MPCTCNRHINYTNFLEMNLIGTIAAVLFILIGVFLAAPLLFTRAFRETYRNSNIRDIVYDLPNWFYYIVLLIISLSFWFGIGVLINYLI